MWNSHGVSPVRNMIYINIERFFFGIFTSNCFYVYRRLSPKFFLLCVRFFGLEGIHLFSCLERSNHGRVLYTVCFLLWNLHIQYPNIVHTTINNADWMQMISCFWRLPNFLRINSDVFQTHLTRASAKMNLFLQGTLQTILRLRICQDLFPFRPCKGVVACSMHLRCCLKTWNIQELTLDPPCPASKLIWQGT